MSTFTDRGIRRALAIFTGTTGIASAVNLVTVVPGTGSSAVVGQFIPQATTRAYLVRAAAGGGGGGGVTNAGATSAGAGGGQSGGYFEVWFFGNTVLNYSVGNRGTGGAAGANGNPGTATTIARTNGYVVASATGGGGGGSSSSVGPPNSRISLVQAFVASSGPAIVLSPNPGDYGENCILNLSFAGKGGDTPLGQGGPGRTTDGVGIAADLVGGGGGGGALSIGAGGSKAGGAGGHGVLVIVEFR